MSEWKVSAEYNAFALDLQQVEGGGYAVPGKLKAVAESADTRIEIQVEVTGGRAHARSVSVQREPEVTSVTLREVPIKDVMAEALAVALMRVEVAGAGVALTPVGEPNEAEVNVIKRVVGYVGMGASRKAAAR
jgi:hypothetical protein